jgi:hypothetical protein
VSNGCWVQRETRSATVLHVPANGVLNRAPCTGIVPPMELTLARAASALCLTAVSLAASASCRGDRGERRQSTEVRAAASSPSDAGRLPMEQIDVRRDAVASEAAPAFPDAGVPASTPSDLGGAGPGTWLEGDLYRLRVSGTRRCRARSSDPDGGVGQTYLGAEVEIVSRVDRLLVAPHDLSLESDGVILQASAVGHALLGCAPPLAVREVRRGKSARGIVMFEIPPGFNMGTLGPTLWYQPTRWGGAKRTQIKLPPCVPDCARAPAVGGSRREGP